MVCVGRAVRIRPRSGLFPDPGPWTRPRATTSIRSSRSAQDRPLEQDDGKESISVMRVFRRRRIAALLCVVLVTTGLVSAPLTVSAKDGDIIRRGSCTMRSDWKLKLSPEDGRIEVEFEVDQNRNGQRWNIKLKRNGSVIWRGSRTTRPPSGSFEVRALARNGPGSETFVARARNPRTGEVCRGQARFGD
jgi:hypothetical protein